jgi:hypothetical protein
MQHVRPAAGTTAAPELTSMPVRIRIVRERHIANCMAQVEDGGRERTWQGRYGSRGSGRHAGESMCVRIVLPPIPGQY